MLVCGASLDPARRNGVLQLVSEPTLAVTRACAGQVHGLVAHDACGPLWHTTWHICRTGHAYVCQEGTFLMGRRGRRFL